MYNWKINQSVDLSCESKPIDIWNETLMIPGDKSAHEWIVEVRNENEPVPMDGFGVTGFFVRPDNKAVIIKGVTRGNLASVTLSSECYAFSGSLRGIMKITDGENMVSVKETWFTVNEQIPDQIIDPGHEIPSLNDLLAQIEAMRQATADANEAAKNANQAVVDLKDAAERGDFDGFSPIVEMADIAGGMRLSITDKNGAKTHDVMDGITPDIQIGTVTKLTPEQTPTVTNSGTQEKPVFDFGIPQGERGDRGYVFTPSSEKVGKKTTISWTNDGNLDNPAPAEIDDGFSPEVTVTPIEKGYEVTIQDAEGQNTFQVMDGFDPVVKTTPIEGGNQVTITDASGDKSFDVMDGKDSVQNNSVASAIPETQCVTESGASIESNWVSTVEHDVGCKVERKNYFDIYKVVETHVSIVDITKDSKSITIINRGTSDAVGTSPGTYLKNVLPYIVEGEEIILNADTTYVGQEKIYLLGANIFINFGVKIKITQAMLESTLLFKAKPKETTILNNIRASKGNNEDWSPYIPDLTQLTVTRTAQDGTTQTYHPEADGTVKGIKSVAPYMKLSADNQGVTMCATYNIDTKSYIDRHDSNAADAPKMEKTGTTVEFDGVSPVEHLVECEVERLNLVDQEHPDAIIDNWAWDGEKWNYTNDNFKGIEYNLHAKAGQTVFLKTLVNTQTDRLWLKIRVGGKTVAEKIVTGTNEIFSVQYKFVSDTDFKIVLQGVSETATGSVKDIIVSWQDTPYVPYIPDLTQVTLTRTDASGNTATVHPQPNGVVTDLYSVSPYMKLSMDNEGAIIKAKCNVSLGKTYASAVVMEGEGRVIESDVVSPIEHGVECKVERKNLFPNFIKSQSGAYGSVEVLPDGRIKVHKVAGTSLSLFTYIHLESAGTYVLSNGLGMGNKIYFQISQGDNYLVTLAYGERSKKFKSGEVKIILYSEADFAGDVTLTPQFEKGSVATPYTQYIPDLTHLTVTRTDKSGATQTYHPEPDGTVNGIMSTSPYMKLSVDNAGAVLSAKWNADTKRYVDTLPERDPIVLHQSGEVISDDIVSPIRHEVGCRVERVNLLPYPYLDGNTTIGDVQFAVLPDRGIRLTGTASKLIFYFLAENCYFGTKQLNSEISPSYGEYIVSLKGAKEKIQLVYNEASHKVYLQIASGIETNITVYPQVEKGSVATPYTPYVPDLTKVKVSRYGKNICDGLDIGVLKNENGDLSLGYNNFASFYIPYLPPCTVSFGFKTNANIWTIKLIENGVLSSSPGAEKKTVRHTGGPFGFSVRENPSVSSWNNYPCIVSITDLPIPYVPYIPEESINPNSDGEVQGMTSVSPNMTILTDTPGLIIHADYNASHQGYIDRKYKLLEEKINNLQSAATGI